MLQPVAGDASTSSAKNKSKRNNTPKENNQEDSLVADTFRRWGHLKADICPLGTIAPFPHRDIDALMDSERASRWKEIYCKKVGVEFMHMPYPERCDWIAERMEGAPSPIDQREILRRILSVESFERFLHTRYVGTKRFSLEGLAAVVPLLDSILDQAAERGFKTVMIAMAHRGRLNVMHHIADTLAEHIIANFEDIDPKSALGSDDVKYHKGATGLYKTWSGKQLEIELAPNPSHLEAVNPVIMGRTRARQERLVDRDKSKVLCVILHGDAAFAGQGIAAEALNFANLRGFRIGGTVHVIVNNLIGFTAVPGAYNSSRYVSDIAKRLDVPIFHVNGESIDDVIRVGRTSLDYRKDFNSDVVIDIIGYRRYGHNEQDDPTLTSPVLYKKIQKRPFLFQLYSEQIGIAEEDIKQLEQGAIAILEDGLEKGRLLTKKPELTKLPNYWEPYFGGFYKKQFEVDTTISAETLEALGKGLTSTPTTFTVHPKLKKLLEQRLEMTQGKRNVDWGMGEALAFGSLLLQGVPVRITGQDSCRGTFNHRQAVLYDQENGEMFTPLRNLSENQARFDVYDSMLSEAAAIGFEYGFTRDYPESLVCWEGQFGDFVNGAQIIIDQFISAGEDKWGSLSGLVLLLPHGYEGAGPEHSSARLERFLQLSAEDNMQVCQPTTSAQYFHLLRRQALRNWRKPLIVMTPKSMLRLPAACPSIDHFTSGKFENVLDADGEEFIDAERLLLCSGKIVHELKHERAKRKITNTAIASVEQLYPLPEEELSRLFKKYSAAKTIIWVQDEPANMGALFFLRPVIERLASNRKVTAIRRSASASPATGSAKAHALEQDAILNMAFSGYE